MLPLASAAEVAIVAIPVASAIVSIATLIYVAIGLRASADAKHVERVENELADARREIELQDKRLELCEADRSALRAEVERMGRREVELMRMVVNLEEREHS